MGADESANFCGAMAVSTKIAEETLYSCKAGISHPVGLTALLQFENDLPLWLIFALTMRFDSLFVGSNVWRNTAHSVPCRQ